VLLLGILKGVLLAAIALGFAILYVVGFAGAHTIHNAAHDTRHSLNFPCH
jgi:cobalt transporter subunit CbtB